MYKTLSDINGSGLISILQTNSDATLLFPIMLIVAVWLIVSLGNFFATIRRYNQADLLASLSVGGFVASIIAGILMLIPNFIPTYIVVITIILELLCSLALFFQKNLKYE